MKKKKKTKKNLCSFALIRKKKRKAKIKRPFDFALIKL